MLTLEGSVAARKHVGTAPSASPRKPAACWRRRLANNTRRASAAHDIGPGQFQGRFLLCPSPPPRTPWTPSGIRALSGPPPQAPILKRFCADAPAATWLRNVRRKPATPKARSRRFPSLWRRARQDPTPSSTPTPHADRRLSQRTRPRRRRRLRHSPPVFRGGGHPDRRADVGAGQLHRQYRAAHHLGRSRRQRRLGHLGRTATRWPARRPC